MLHAFTPAHRGGSGPPLVCLHGFTDTWRTWELVLPSLQRHHDVLALTLAGHAGGPPLEDPATDASLADAVEAAMDAAGFTTAHLVGNSLGGYVALQLAARGRARSVPELIAHQMLGVVGCTGLEPLLALVLRDGYRIDAEHVTCPVRVVWGTEDALLPWPVGATRYREEWLPHADWVELDGVGHSPQLDVPLEAAQLVTGFTDAA